MSNHRSVLCALALFVVVPMMGGGSAEAGGFGKIRRIASHTSDQGAYRVAVVDDGTASSVTASVKSDAGSENVTLVESDAWLHGAATIKALPKTDATLTLTLYDKGSASLMSFSGTLGTDGAVALTADATKDTGGGGTCDASYRTGCADDTSDTSATTLDIEVLAAEVFAASGGYELGIDLAGADTYEVAYAAITVDETVTLDSTEESCSYDRKGGLCVLSGTVRSQVEVGWDAVGAVWEGELTVEPEGVIDVKVKSYDMKGEELESTKVALGVPWIDGGEGVNVLALDEDPLTGVGVLRRGYRGNGVKCQAINNCDRMAVTSEGWTSTTVPVSAKVELTDGGTITIPVNSYQRLSFDRGQPIGLGLVDDDYSLIVTGGSLTLYDSARTEFGEPSCSNGICLRFIKDEQSGEIFVHSSEYGTDATKLADTLDLTVTVYDKAGVKQSSEYVTVEFEDDITAVFANEITFSEDPIGLDLSGKVSLLGAADSKGKQKTLAKGKFYGSFSRDGDGDLVLAGEEKDAVSSEGSIVVAGDSVAFELTDTNKDGVVNGPPLVAMYGDIILGGMKLDDFND